MQGGRKVDEARKVMGRCRCSFYCEKDERPLRVLKREVTGLAPAVLGPPENSGGKEWKQENTLEGLAWARVVVGENSGRRGEWMPLFLLAHQ